MCERHNCSVVPTLTYCDGISKPDVHGVILTAGSLINSSVYLG